MAITLRLIDVAGSVGVVLPPEVLERLEAGEGDSLYWTDIPGGIEIRGRDRRPGEAEESIVFQLPPKN